MNNGRDRFSVASGRMMLQRKGEYVMKLTSFANSTQTLNRTKA